MVPFFDALKEKIFTTIKTTHRKWAYLLDTSLDGIKLSIILLLMSTDSDSI